MRIFTVEELQKLLAYKAARKQPTTNKFDIHVGDLFYCSWGYNMTVVDFYQVVDVKGSCTVYVRPIAADHSGNETGECWPLRDHFTGEPIKTHSAVLKYADHVSLSNPEKAIYRRMHPTTDTEEHYYNTLD